jgi:hypothetical protein
VKWNVAVPGVVGARGLPVAPAVDDLGLRVGEQAGERLVPSDDLDGGLPRQLDVELLFEVQGGLLLESVERPF